MTSRFHRALFAAWFLAVAVVAALALWQPLASANGRVIQFIRQTAGPYQLAIGTIPDTPTVGSLHLTVEITDKDTKTPVLGANVVVTGTSPSETQPSIGPIEAEASITDIGFYDVNTSVDEIGTWIFNMTINSLQLGSAESEFAIEVKNPNPFVQVFTWLTVIVFLAVVGLGLLPLIRQRARRRRRRGRRAS
ncbi:MAG: hypothetical protein ACRDIB_13135 [Ardenticatenaceae bacterium]